MIWDASDANPMHRRIPAEVVSRRARPEPKKQVVEQKADEDLVPVDLKTAVALKPDARPKWLGKAIGMVENGKASATELFDIVTNRKFVSGLPDRVRRRVVAIILDCQNIFSDKQRRYLLSSECSLTRETVPLPVAKVDEPPEEKKEQPPPPAVLAVPANPAAEALAGAAVEKLLTGERLSSGLLKGSSPLASEKPRPSLKDTAASHWEVAQDESAIRRQEKEMKELAMRNASRREEKRRREAMFEDLVREDPQAKLAAQKRKLEDDADALFSRAFGQQNPEQNDDRGHKAKEKEKEQEKPRSRSRASRSISSRTARKTARAEREKKATGRGQWQRSAEIATGSRAIFMHRDFQEDLPHLPRPNQPGTMGMRQSTKSPPRDRGRGRSRGRGRRRSPSSSDSPWKRGRAAQKPPPSP